MTQDETHDRLPSLQAIAEWLESPEPPSRAQALRLFETVIPAALDVETADLLDRSRELLRQAAGIAGVDELTLARTAAIMTGQPILPQSCAECPEAEPVHSYGSYILRCLYEQGQDSAIASRPTLSVIGASVAFAQPADITVAQLRELVSDKPVPPWCPKR